MQVSPPVRVKRSFTQKLSAPPEQIFPLLCPVRETEWVNGWDPRLVITRSGYIEPECTFVMPGEPQDSIWTVTHWDPEDWAVEFVKVTPEFTVGRIEIKLRAGEHAQTLADIDYTYTALSPAGSEFVEQFTAEAYEAFMKEWESELEHYLQTGRKKDKPAAL
jgi:hypothetical protein